MGWRLSLDYPLQTRYFVLLTLVSPVHGLPR